MIVVRHHPTSYNPLGVLFGLGFDTASEIGLLGISAPRPADCRSIDPGVSGAVHGKHGAVDTTAAADIKAYDTIKPMQTVL